MPIYEYQCKNCKKKSELLVSMSKADSVVCPDCGSSEMERQISLAAPHVSASGASKGASEMPSCPYSGFCDGGECPL